MYKNSWEEKIAVVLFLTFLSTWVDLKSNVDSTETGKKLCLNIVAHFEVKHNLNHKASQSTLA